MSARRSSAATPAASASTPGEARAHDVPGAQMARELRSFQSWLLTATPAELAELTARHDASGYAEARERVAAMSFGTFGGGER